MNPADANDRLGSAEETALVALAMTGDDRAFTELVRRRQGAVRGLLRRLCGDPALADDLAQETFLLAWRKLGALRSPGAFGAWLKRIAVNLFLQHARRAGRSHPDSGEAESYPATPGRKVSMQMDLDRALARLRPEERLCVVLSYGDRMSHGEICAATGLPLGTVKTHISRGGAKLRRLLSDYKRSA